MAVTGRRRLPIAFLLVVITVSSCTFHGADTKVAGTADVGTTSSVEALTTRVSRAFLGAGNSTDITVTPLTADAAVRRLCAGHLDVVGLDRAATAAEVRVCGARMTAPIAVANDAITVIVNRRLRISCLRRSQLRRWWSPSSDGTLTTWNQLDPSYPRVTMDLFGPGPTTATFTTFADAVERGRHDIRHDFTVADETVVVAGVAAAPGGAGLVSYPSFVRAANRVTAVGIDAGAGCIAPSRRTVRNGSYVLSHPLYLYVNVRSWRTNAAVRALVRYFVDHARDLAAQDGYIAASRAQQAAAKSTVDALG